MPQNKINIAILLGDPSGIGPELVSKLLSEQITNKANVVVIGEKNIIREYVTINPGTEGGGGKTIIGNNCLLMISSHVVDQIKKKTVTFEQYFI